MFKKYANLLQKDRCNTARKSLKYLLFHLGWFAITFCILKGAVWLNLLCYVIAYKPHQPAVEMSDRDDKKDKQTHQVISEHFWELQQERRKENLQMCLDKWRHSNSSLFIPLNTLAKRSRGESGSTTIRKQLLLLKPVIGVPRLHWTTTTLLPGSQ